MKLGWFTWSRACRKDRWALPAKASALEDNYSKFQNPEKKKKKTLETFSRSPPFDPFPFNRQGKCVWRVWLAQDHKVGWGGTAGVITQGGFVQRNHTHSRTTLFPQKGNSIAKQRGFRNQHLLVCAFVHCALTPSTGGPGGPPEQCCLPQAEPVCMRRS